MATIIVEMKYRKALEDAGRKSLGTQRAIICLELLEATRRLLPPSNFEFTEV